MRSETMNKIKKAYELLGIEPLRLALEASVSITTLYKVLNGEDVKESTKNKVIEALERLRNGNQNRARD